MSVISSVNDASHNFIPPSGYVPDEQTAIRIAIAVWEPIYGPMHIANKKPFHAQLLGDVWIVEGSLPKGVVGGVPIAEISKVDGRIVRVSHGR